ncbi:MAG TPA: type II secretion system F family protein [Bacilli bacterium]|nr:type II secretion system F family protein [Bacilli bacterium]
MNDKPIFLWPFIIVYRIVKFIIKLPILFLHYLLLGFFFTFYFLMNSLINIGIFASRLWYRFLRYFFIGLTLPVTLLYKNSNSAEKKEIRKQKQKQEELARKEKEKQREELRRAKEKESLERIKKQEEIRLAKEKELQEQRLAKQAEEQRIAKEKEALQHAKNEMAVKDEKKKNDVLVEQQINKTIEENKGPSKEEIKAQLLEQRKKEREEKEQQRKELIEKLKKEKEEREKKRKEEIERNKKRRANDSYVNENVVIEKKKLGDVINNGLEALISVPKKFTERIKKKYENSTFVKNKKNKESMEREALLINFNGEDAEKSDKKVVYEYVGKNAEGKIIKSYFEAFSKVEVHSFLLSEGFEVYSIRTNKMIQLFHGSKQVSHVKFKMKDLLFFLTQLSTYIKAGIPLVESLRILSRQFENKSYQKIFRAMIYDLTMGDNFSDAMGKQGDAFPKILVNMIEAAEMTGELPETLDDMAEYFTESDKTRKQMITAMTYPAIILVLAVGALSFIMIYIVPKFTAIYASMDNAELPGITLFITNLSNFLANNYIYLIVGIIVGIGVFMYLYKNVKLFRTLVQYILMHIPIVKNIIIYNEVTMFTKTFASLLRHNVFITDTMEILNKITNNEIWKMIILDTITNLAKGEKISVAFKDHWAVPIPAYEMIVTGERTGQLPEMMQKVSEYYQELHKNSVGRIKSFIEPILILFLTGVVGLIVLSIVIPMFSMYDNIN